MQSPPEHLLLLTSPPWPPTSDALREAYKQPLTATLKHLVFEYRRSRVGVVLDIALPVPYLYEHRHEPRALLYETTQTLVARLYKLVCIIAAAEDIDVEDAEGVDVRIILVARPRKEGIDKTILASALEGDEIGPLINLPTLARCQRPWQSVISIDNEEGDELLRQYVTAQDNRVKTVVKVTGGSTRTEQADTDALSPPREGDVHHHQAVAVGGTWDHIHIGHKLLLTMFAFLLKAARDSSGEGLYLTVGITGDELLKNKKHAEVLESWHERQRSTLRFLRGIMDFRPAEKASIQSDEVHGPGPNGHVVNVQLDHHLTLRLVEISDPFGPTITDANLTALVVSGETRGGGKAVNDKRVEKGWPMLQVLEVDVLDASEETADGQVEENFASKLSSTTIRQRLSEKQLKSKA